MEFNFWKGWHPSFKYPYLFFVTLAVPLLIFFLVLAFGWLEPSISWEKITSSEELKVPIGKVTVGLFELELKNFNYFLTSFYRGSDLQLFPKLQLAVLFFSFFCLSGIIALSTFLPRYPFLIIASFCVLLMAVSKIGELNLFDLHSRYTLVLLLLPFLALSYYFHAYNQGWGLYRRWFLYILFFTLFFALVYLGSDQQQPLLYFSGLAALLPLGLSILFVILVAPDIIFTLLKWLSDQKGPNKSAYFKHFVILSLIYLLNIALLFAKTHNLISWDIIYLNAFFLLAASAFAGIWVFKHKLDQFNTNFAFYPAGALLYILLMLITFTTLGWYFWTANDALIEAFEDFIVYTHLGFGFMFLAYLLVNFINPMLAGLPTYKVAFKPNTFPYSSAMIFALILSLALFFWSGRAAYSQMIGAINNGLGDYFASQGDDFMAAQYYQEGANYAFNNQRSHYALAKLAEKKENSARAKYHYEIASKKNPTAFAYANWSNLEQSDKAFFQSLFVLDQAQERLGSHPYLDLNKGLLFSKTNMYDSAYWYMNAGSKRQVLENTALANMLYLGARQQLDFPTDSVLQLVKKNQFVPSHINFPGWLNAIQDAAPRSYPEIPVELDAQGPLNFDEMAWYSNYASRKSFEDSLFQKIQAKDSMGKYSEALERAQVFQSLYQNQLPAALQSIDVLANTSMFNRGYYFDLMGLIHLQVADYPKAAGYFEEAQKLNHKEAAFHRALALSEGGQKDAAIAAWSNLLAAPDTKLDTSMLIQMVKVLRIEEPADLDSLDDLGIYQWIRFNKSQRLQIELAHWVDQMESPALRQKICLDLFYENLFAGFVEEAVQWFEASTQSGAVYPGNEEVFLVGRAYTHHALGDAKEALEAIKQWRGRSTRPQKDWDHYFKALEALSRGEKEKAGEQYRKAAMSNPFLVPLVMEAINYWNEEMEDVMEGYEIARQSIEFNKNAPQLLKAYILQCIKIGLETYAEEAMERLREIVGKDEFMLFKQVYDLEIRQRASRSAEDWS